MSVFPNYACRETAICVGGAVFAKTLSPRPILKSGLATGESLALARPPTRAIEVDPQPNIIVPFAADVRLFSETSDEFFAKDQLISLLAGRPLSLAFIDGEHVFAQSLKDFMHVEPFCGKRSITLMHDTVPLDEVTQRPARRRKFYTGDVWKTVLCLKHYRPDLDIFTIATPWTGLTVVGGLDPTSRVLSKNYEAAVARFNAVRYSEIETCLNVTLNVVPNDWHQVSARLRARGLLPADRQ